MLPQKLSAGGVADDILESVANLAIDSAVVETHKNQETSVALTTDAPTIEQPEDEFGRSDRTAGGHNGYENLSAGPIAELTTPSLEPSHRRGIQSLGGVVDELRPRGWRTKRGVQIRNREGAVRTAWRSIGHFSMAVRAMHTR